ncbi:TauD/TfdA family dioxygenase [Streptomyces malaysiensis]|uniref:TauD/TfdA family dioxygenase n=1 Tax=Streptomyces malaysiensis subsp. samsunensis TaxID=459658 RepID=A0A9X2M476_STRMQ|nr:TauD/TfdA family dioxygenase [Streptomyces samsunensis]MCQ8834849.1 TauD/TfdA family dioxygenase [Streptomyces samsunensis]
MQETGPTTRVVLKDAERALVEDVVYKVLENCPGQTEYRYLTFLKEHVDTPIGWIRETYESAEGQPVLLSNLPQFENVEHSKILALLIGQTVGNCVAYSDYNGSYITDIRATELSREKSAGTDLLAMHNDLAWASDVCRPRTLVLVPHMAEGVVPRTLLAPATEVAARLDPAAIEILRSPVFEARSGSSLGWKYERVRKMPLLEEAAGKLVVRLNFSAFTPAAHLEGELRAAAAAAHQQLHDAALAVGRVRGHAALQGEALIVPNDHCLHGRDPIDSGACRRLLLRSYVVPDSVVEHHGRTMISLEG